MLSTAYMAHYNAPKFYWELQNRNAKQYTMVVYTSFGIAILLMMMIASTGYSTFGTACQSLILNNYSSLDRYMSFSRWAVVVSLLFSYPLAFGGVRDGILNLVGLPQEYGTQRSVLSNGITVLLLSIITCIASILKDIRIVISLNGATWGTLFQNISPLLVATACICRLWCRIE
jgi:amino acid permease